MNPTLKMVDLNAVRLNPVALRDVNRESEAFRQLVDSIKSEGVLSAVSMRPVSDSEKNEDGKTYILIDGLQRYTASQEAGKTEIPANIMERNEAESLVTQIIGNAHKIETKPIEYSRAILRILGYYPTMTETELAAKLAKSPQWIGKILGLNKLQDNIKPLVDDDKISLNNAFVLAKFPPEEQLLWIDRAQTMSAPEFQASATERQKAIKEANRKGVDAGEEVFVPIATFRNKKEIETEMEKPVMGPALVKDGNIVANLKTKEEAAVAGFNLGLRWALNFDPKSIEIQRQKDEERRKKNADDKVRREAEKQEKRAKEASELAAKTQAAAAEARTKAQSLGGTKSEPALQSAVL